MLPYSQYGSHSGAGTQAIAWSADRQLNIFTKKLKYHPAKAQTINWVEASNEIVRRYDHEGVSVFTDVSKTDFGVGSSIVVYEDDAAVAEKSFGLTPFATVMQAELTSVLNALQLCG